MTGLAAHVATALAFALAVAKGPDAVALAAAHQIDISGQAQQGWLGKQTIWPVWSLFPTSHRINTHAASRQAIVCSNHATMPGMTHACVEKRLCKSFFLLAVA